MSPQQIVLASLSIFSLAAGASGTQVYDWYAKQSGAQWSIYIRNGSTIPATFQITCRSGGSATSIASFIVEAKPRAETSKSFPFVAGQTMPDKSHCDFSGKAGYASATGRITYRLPFIAKRGVCVGQAPGSQLTTHQGDPSSVEAIDFLLEEGEEVVAARDGIVNMAIDKFDRGGPSEAYRNSANVIEIVHSDGTIAEYAHLLKGSVRVKEGQVVRAGETIAAAGMSGQAAGPHLHFAIGHPLVVTGPIGQPTLQGMVSLPVNFQIGGQPITVHLGDLIQASDRKSSYQAKSAKCVDHRHP